MRYRNNLRYLYLKKLCSMDCVRKTQNAPFFLSKKYLKLHIIKLQYLYILKKGQRRRDTIIYRQNYVS